MQLRTYRATARQLLKGHWQMMATLVIIWLLVEMGTDTLLQSLFETNSFGYQMLNTFANYLFYFVFLNAVFLAAYKLTIKKETRLSDTLVLFRPPFLFVPKPMLCLLTTTSAVMLLYGTVVA